MISSSIPCRVARGNINMQACHKLTIENATVPDAYSASGGRLYLEAERLSKRLEMFIARSSNHLNETRKQINTRPTRRRFQRANNQLS